MSFPQVKALRVYLEEISTLNPPYKLQEILRARADQIQNFGWRQAAQHHLLGVIDERRIAQPAPPTAPYPGPHFYDAAPALAPQSWLPFIPNHSQFQSRH